MGVRHSFRGAAGRLLLALALIAPTAAALAHEPPPVHGCHAPSRPANDQDDVLWQQFLDAVDAFRACISDYAEANRRAAEAHNKAANEATMDWNRFVRTELNVPEDYPWPPEERGQENGR